MTNYLRGAIVAAELEADAALLRVQAAEKSIRAAAGGPCPEEQIAELHRACDEVDRAFARLASRRHALLEYEDGATVWARVARGERPA